MYIMSHFNVNIKLGTKIFTGGQKSNLKAAQFFIPLEKGEARLQTFTHA